MNIAIFASGRGTNFQAIVDAIKARRLNVKLVLLVCDNPLGFVLERAKKEKIKSVLVKRQYFKTREDFEGKIVEYLEKERVELICLAGFMRILSPLIINKYKNKIINIHPALLPSFKGAHAIKDAFDYGVKVTGVSVHFVDENIDHGPIILQEPVKIKEDDTLQSLEEKIHKTEHKLYPEAIRLFSEGKMRIKKRKVCLLNPKFALGT